MRELAASHHRALSELLDVVAVANGRVTATFAPIGGEATKSDGPARVPTVSVVLGKKWLRVQRPTFTACADVLMPWVLEECAKQERREA